MRKLIKAVFVSVNEDVPHRTTGEGTWLEAGNYRLVRELHNNRLLIAIKELGKDRQLTIVSREETA